MSETRMNPPRRNRIGAVLFWLALAALVVAILWQGGGLLSAGLEAVNAQREPVERRPAYQATATAMLEPTQAARRLPGLARPAFQATPAPFATNTPSSGAVEQPTARPGLPIVSSTSEALFSTEPVTRSTDIPAIGSPPPLPTFFAYDDGRAGQEAGGTAIPTAVTAVNRNSNDLVNILLLGNDGEITDDGFIRTDTMIILSINRTSGTVSMLSLPRDLYVYIPDWTMQRLNIAYIYGENGGWPNGGFGLMRQTIFYNFGVNIHYYAMVNLTGFTAAIDAVGGVELTVDCAIQNLPLIGAEVPPQAVRINEDGEYVLNVGRYEMTGAQALWYARSRDNSSDFDRGRRQMQILRAIWRKTRDSGLLANLPSLWSQADEILDTNLTLADVIGLLPTALNLDPGQIESFTLTRTYDTTPWQTPSGDYVQIINYENLRPKLEDFYTPPTESQITASAASIVIYNGSPNADWDRVAAETLGWEGFDAQAMGTTEVSAQTILIDRTGATKGSSLQAIAQLLNVRPENVRIEPDPNRTADFEVILGANYNSCTTQGILPVDTPVPG